MRGQRRARPGGCSRGGEGGRAVLICGAGFVTCLRGVRGWRRPRYLLDRGPRLELIVEAEGTGNPQRYSFSFGLLTRL